MIVISTHAVFLNGKDVYGPPHAVSLYLNQKKIAHLFIKHPLYGGRDSLIEEYQKGKLVSVKQVDCTAPQSFLQYFKEIRASINTVRTAPEKITVFIGVDPLNMLAATFLKLTGQIQRSVYFSADFAIKRFDGIVMNTIYHLLDSVAMYTSDQTWSVSSRIVEYRRQHGLSVAKNLIMPNAPFFHSVKRVSEGKTKPHDIVLVSALEKGIAFELLFDSIAEVKQKVKNVRLLLVGAGSLEKQLKKYVQKKKLSQSVKFLGALTHEEMFKVLVKAGLGIALYENSDPTHFRYFSDPMKVRDYLASGLPALVSGNSAIGDELEKEHAGFKLELSQMDVVKKILQIFQKTTLQKKMRKNALELAKKYDTFALLEKYFKKLQSD
jgi:glycosyltransferase involved in cell wall biosynthesis